MKKLLFSILTIVFTLGVSAQCPPVLDQSNTSFTGGSSDSDYWQSFIAGSTGDLSQINIIANGGVNTTLTISIYDGQGLGGTLLYSGSHTFNQSGVQPELVVTIPCSQMPSVTLGSTYTIRSQGSLSIVFSGSNPYGNGYFYRSSDGVHTGWDMCFKTFVSNPNKPVNNITSSNPTCFGGADGQMTNTPSLGTAPYSWNWSSGGTTSTINVGAGIYTGTVTDANSCVSCESTITIVDPPQVTVNATADQTKCEGVGYTIPAAAINAITYSWSPTIGLDNATSLNPTATPTTTTTYSLSASDGNGCTATDAITINVNPAPTVIAPADISVCDGQTVTLTGSGSATGYTWDNSVLDNTSFTPGVGSVNYTVTGTDANSCTNTDNVNVTVNVLPTVTAPGDFTICEGQSVTLTGTGTAGSYSWNNGVTDNLSFEPGIGTLNYIVTGLNGATGCTNTDNVNVTVNALPTVTITADQDICVGSNVIISVSGAASYLWDNGLGAGSSQVVSPGTTTEYFVTSTGANSCTKLDSVTISVQSYPVVTASADITTCEGNFTTISASGSPDYTWDNGLGVGSSHSVSPTSTTEYFVSSTNAYGCTKLDSVTVTVNPLPVIVANATDNLLCEGDQVTLTGQGGVTYVWDNGVTDNTTFTPAVGNVTYTVTGTDANNCENTDQIDIDVNAIPTVNAGADVTQCENEEVIFMATGAVNYTWSSGATNGEGILYTPGNYNFTVTGADANGCENTDDFTFTINPSPNLVVSDNQYFCKDQLITLFANGADEVIWEDGQSTGSTYELNLTSSTNISVKGTTAGCETEKIIELYYEDPINVGAGEDQEICPDFEASLTATGGNSYEWSGPNIDNMSTQTINVVPEFSDFYHVTITTDHCEYKDSVYVDIIISQDCGISNSNTISPNGDGVNDEWVIDGIAAYPENSVLIYNRWGDVVFEAQNYDNVNVKWVGEQLNGITAQPGTYFYQINLTNGPSYSGWIELMR